MRINVALANRGQPLLELPPEEGQPAGLSLPLLTHLWYGQSVPLLALCARATPEAAGPPALRHPLAAESRPVPDSVIPGC